MVERSESFGERLRRHREAAGLSQEELAEKAQLSAKAIGALERGERRRPYPATLRQLAAALDLEDADRAALTAAARQSLEPTTVSVDAVVSPHFELPRYLTSLVGREREVEVVLQLLRRPDIRLLTLTGPGGIGKTRLAVEVAVESEDDFPDGIFFVDLAPLSDARQVPVAIAQVVGARESSGHDAIQNAAVALRDRRALLLLDNCEHVLDAAPNIVALLSACPRLTLLATSRARLRVRGEQEYRVPPLELPRTIGTDSAEFVESASVALFVERARSVQPGFELNPEFVEAIIRICERLDGLPLAIELAAARVSLLSPPALLSRLESGLQLLTSGARDLPARQRTMRDAVAWSYDLLTDAEQLVFQRLAVFVDGCTLDAAEVVCSSGQDGEDTVLEYLTALLDSSLIYRQAGGEDPRIVMLGTIRAFAAEQLTASGQQEEAARRHADFYFTFALTAGPHLMTSEQVVWLHRLRRDSYNLRAAIRFLLQRGDIERVVAMCWALWRFWWLAGFQREARQWMHAVLSIDQARGMALSPQQRGQALLVVGSMAWSEGDGPAAVGALTDAIESCRESGDTVEQAIAAMMLGLALLIVDAGDLDEPLARFDESLQLFRNAGARWGESFAVGYLGLIPLLRGELNRAGQYFEESLRIAQEASHDRVPLHQALYSLGLVAQQRGDYESAEIYFTDGLRLAHELGDLVNAGYFIKGLGQSAGMLGRSEHAACLLGAASAALEATGSPPYRYLWNRTLDDQVIGAARMKLGEDRFSLAWSRGQSIGLDRAIAEAIASVVDRT